MIFEVINNPAFKQPAGFTQRQFRKLDQLYCASSSNNIINYRSVECDFDEGTATYTYYLSAHDSPYLQFVIRKIGSNTTMFELFKRGSGRIIKSGIFERTYDRLCREIDLLSE